MGRLLEPFVFFVLFLLCFVMIPIRLPRPLESEFAEFVRYFHKPYENNTDEYQRRYEIFERAFNKIKEMNQQRPHEDSAKYGATEYTDMTEYEFLYAKLSHDMLKLDVEQYRRLHPNMVFERAAVSLQDLPKRIDWRAKGLVSAVRDQGACGACWAHSVTSTVETMVAIRWNRSTVEPLSVQQMIDCGNYGQSGCKGGDTCLLLDWLKTNKIGFMREGEYPLTKWQETCAAFDSSDNHRRPFVVDYTCENLKDQETKILKYLANVGPVVAAVNALQWQNYVGGVIQYHCDGDIRNLNHAVQLVGYVLDGPTPYYIARNSWGTRFGDKGYVKIAIGGNVCGLEHKVSSIKVE